RILGRLRLDRFNGVEDLLEAVKGKSYPVSAAFANVLQTVQLNFRYALRRKLIADDEFAKDVGPRLDAEAVRVNGTAGHSIAELAKDVWKDTKPDDFPAHWFDRTSGQISYPFGEVPEPKDVPRVDLNTAGREDLLQLPGVESEIADAVLRY